jgi:hypothetical protein
VPRPTPNASSTPAHRRRRFGELRPLWTRAYADLGRPQLHDRLDAMAYAFAAAEAATDDEE